MTSYIWKYPCLAMLIVSMYCLWGCGDSTMEEQTAAVEIRPVPQTDTADFYPFDEPPVLTKYEMPDYPKSAKEEHLEGTVMVKVTVGVGGNVEDVAILESSNSIFEESARRAAAACRFDPAQLKGRPTKSRVAIPFHFRLED